MAQDLLIENAQTDVPQTEVLTLNLQALSVPVTDEELEQLCRDNEEWKFERNAKGKLVFVAPTGGTTGIKNNEISFQLTAWAKKDGTGIVFDSSTLFALPNGARRSPDASWIRCERWVSLTETEQQRYAPICPDFVVELRSLTDRLNVLQAKMREYIEQGAQLGWLIDPSERRVHVYHANREVQVLENVESVSGESLLSGFTLNLKEIW